MVYINENTREFDLTAALAEVSPQRREQALKFRHESGQRLSLAVYLLLKKGLRKEYGITENPVLGYSEGGKPFILDHPNIHFSFSHANDIALCVISDEPVGADVEMPRKISSSLVSYTMNDDEQAQINTSFILLRIPSPVSLRRASLRVQKKRNCIIGSGEALI